MEVNAKEHYQLLTRQTNWMSTEKWIPFPKR